MTVDFGQFKHINEAPFAAIMQRVGTHPALLDFLVPGIDMVIWQMRRCLHDAVDTELRQSALRALDRSVEASGDGAEICEFDYFSFIAFWPTKPLRRCLLARISRNPLRHRSERCEGAQQSIDRL